MPSTKFVNPLSCPRCGILPTIDNPLLPAGHCHICEYELNTTPLQRAKDVANGIYPLALDPIADHLQPLGEEDHDGAALSAWE